MLLYYYIGINNGCEWHGTSPICDGGCSKIGQYVKAISTVGDGVACLTVRKVLCCPGANTTTGVFWVLMQGVVRVYFDIQLELWNLGQFKMDVTP